MHPEASPLEPSEEDAEVAYRREVWARLPRNYRAHLTHGLLGQAGFRLIQAPTFVPAYLFLLSGSDLVVGIARGLQAFGMFLSPILSATLVEHRRRVLPVGFVVGAAMRVQVLGIGLGGLLLPAPWNLYAVCLFLGLFGFFLGMQGVILSYLVSKVIPLERRGFLMGLRNALAGLTAAAVAYVGGRYLVGGNALGDGYAATFLVSCALMSLGLVALLFIREPQPPALRSATRVRDRMRDLPELLRSDRAYTIYFLARALTTMGRMAVPFYILHAGSRIELTGTSLGVLTLGFLLAETTTNLAWGWVADRTGFRRIFLFSVALWILSALLLVQSSDFSSFVVVFAGLGAGLGGFRLSGQNLVLEFGVRQDLPMRIAVANSASELVGAIGPVVGGLLAATVWSYVGVIWLAVGFKLAGVLLVAFLVDEPRGRS